MIYRHDDIQEGSIDNLGRDYPKPVKRTLIYCLVFTLEVLTKSVKIYCNCVQLKNIFFC